MVQEPGDFYFLGFGLLGLSVPVVLAFWYRTCLEFFCEWCDGDQLVFIRGGVYYIYMSCNGLFLRERKGKGKERFLCGG